MEQNVLVLPKKVWRLLRVLYFMLRKNISKSKLLLDLNKMIKRHKIASKSVQNLFPPSGEYEFSCSNNPSTSKHHHHPFSMFSFHKKHHFDNIDQKAEDGDIMAVNAAVFKAMEMIHSETASPGFGRSPVVRKLRVTDSPFPLSRVDEDSHVDEAAEQFISRFYNDLRREINVTPSRSSS